MNTWKQKYKFLKKVLFLKKSTAAVIWNMESISFVPMHHRFKSITQEHNCEQNDPKRCQPHTHTHTFNDPLSGTTRVSRYQKGKTNLAFTEARDSEWQWHQLGHMQVCTSLQTDTTPALHRSVFYRPDALPATQPTVSKHWRHNHLVLIKLIHLAKIYLDITVLQY